MKKFLFALLLTILIGLPSCKDKGIEYDPYELEKYDGYVLVGTMHDVINKTDIYSFILVNGIEHNNVDVSKKTFGMYSLGDTIHCVRPTNKPIKNDSVSLNNQDTMIYILEKIGNHEYIFSKYGGIEHNEDCAYCNRF